QVEAVMPVTPGGQVREAGPPGSSVERCRVIGMDEDVQAAVRRPVDIAAQDRPANTARLQRRPEPHERRVRRGRHPLARHPMNRRISGTFASSGNVSASRRCERPTVSTTNDEMATIPRPTRNGGSTTSWTNSRTRVATTIVAYTVR